MALRQLMLSKKIEQRKAALAELLEQENGLNTRSAELEAAIDEAKDDEEIAAVEEAVSKLDADKTELAEKKGTLEGEIAALEGELEQLNSAAPSNQSRSTKNHDNEREANAMNRLQVRELLKSGEYYKRSEVTEFYEQFKNLRSVAGGELTIPEIVVNRIMDIMGDFTTLYPLVDKIQVKGTTRILVDSDTTAATWIEQSGAIPQGDVGTITNVDFDGFKVGKVTFVDNYLLQDSIINLDAYVTKKIARAIAKALDKAIVSGTGAANKQPAGVVPAIPAGNQVNIEADADLLKNLVKQIGLIDTGEDSVGEIVAVMKRQTYYNRLVEYSIQVDSNGNVVGKLPNLKNPDLLGLRVVFNNNLPADQVLFGDFQQYTLVERESITIDSSTHVKFSEDQTAFRGKGRFDGKPVKPAAFALVTITPEV
ncbi:phage major capsid protein [Cohnella lubricantis]|uniref:Phage major capsid protein n=1 Tax=Cohnella lubricantis TaxID=2163172 RepID=A0A841TDW2_9BACL|nr:phage major capsid protein [Cohnella lubricantis]MBB6677518.1 phage major capsid protein [Cohnella lubricantis]MBP2116596.1 HK97 family phage major capsid protein [Cohnella lubricantis]